MKQVREVVRELDPNGGGWKGRPSSPATRTKPTKFDGLDFNFSERQSRCEKYELQAWRLDKLALLLDSPIGTDAVECSCWRLCTKPDIDQPEIVGARRML